MRPWSEKSSEHGFSLVEAMAALFVFAVAGVGLVQLQATSAATLARVEERALAQLAAQNALVDLMAGPQLPASETFSFAGRDWRRTIETAPTDAADVVRVTVRVAPLERPGAGAAVHGFVTTRPPGAPA